MESNKSRIHEIQRQLNTSGMPAQMALQQTKGGQSENDELAFDTDPYIIQKLNDVVNFRLGQTLDEVRGNAMILSGIAAPVRQV